MILYYCVCVLLSEELGVGVACIGVLDMVLVCMSFDGEANDERGEMDILHSHW